MRQHILDFLPDVATPCETQRVSDGTGGTVVTWVAVENGSVPCRLDPLYYKKELPYLGDMPISEVNFVLTVPHDAPIEAHQRVGRERRRVSRRGVGRRTLMAGGTPRLSRRLRLNAWAGAPHGDSLPNPPPTKRAHPYKSSKDFSPLALYNSMKSEGEHFTRR